jgi:hypothetical protein
VGDFSEQVWGESDERDHLGDDRRRTTKFHMLAVRFVPTIMKSGSTPRPAVATA